MKVRVYAVEYNDGHHYGCVQELATPDYRKATIIAIDCRHISKRWSEEDAINAAVRFVLEQGWEYVIDTTNDNIEEVVK